VTETKTHRVTE